MVTGASTADAAVILVMPEGRAAANAGHTYIAHCSECGTS